jgi:hypothetical protein
VVTVALTPDETAKLNRLRCLDLDKLEDREAIAAAIHLLLASVEM